MKRIPSIADMEAADRIPLWLQALVIVATIAGSSLFPWGFARAGTVGAHLATHHFGMRPGDRLESVTPGVYLRTDAGLTLGLYRNSHALPSAYAAWTWQTSSGRFALTAGAVTGYPAAPVMPLLVPSVRLPLAQRIAARIAFLPKPMKHGHAGLHLSIERAL